MTTKFLSGIDANSQRVQSVGDPTTASDAATKSYVDNLINGLVWKAPVVAASTGNVTISSAPATLDTVSLAADDRILLKDQTSGSENGIYVYSSTGAALTRATDADTATELKAATVKIQDGSANADKSYTMTTDSVTLGTTSLVWVENASGITYVAGSGLTESPAGTFNVNPGSGLDINADSIRIATGAAGDGLTGGGGSALAVGAGSGITVTADAVAVDTSVVVTTPSTVVRKYAQNVGALTAGTPLTITHSLNTLDITAQLITITGGDFVFADIKATGVNTLSVTSATAVSANVYRIVVHG